MCQNIIFVIVMFKMFQSVTTSLLLFQNWNVMRAKSDERHVLIPTDSEEAAAVFRVAEDPTTKRKPLKPLCGPVRFPEISCEDNTNLNENHKTWYTFRSTTDSDQNTSSYTSKSLPSRYFVVKKIEATTPHQNTNKHISESVPMILRFLLRSTSFTSSKASATSSNKGPISSHPISNLFKLRTLRVRNSTTIPTEQTSAVLPVRAKIISNRSPNLRSRYVSKKHAFETLIPTAIDVVEGVFEPRLAPRFRDDGQSVRSSREHMTITMPHFVGGVVPSAATVDPDIQKCGNIAVCILQSWDKQRIKKQLKETEADLP